jgi:hypothetical protein
MLRPMTCLHTTDPPPQLVSELIDVFNVAWDRDMLQKKFLPMDRDLILSIPLSTRRQDDFWAWHYDKEGVFSVRSAYRMLIDTRVRRTAWLDELPRCSSMKEREKEWTAIWKVPVPSKIRVFLWRLAKQSLPTADVLHHRNMAPQQICSICGQDDSWTHSLLHCNMARNVWALAPEEITEMISSIQEPSAGAWLAAVFEALPHDDLTRTIVTLWALWHARRKAIHEGIFQSP